MKHIAYYILIAISFAACSDPDFSIRVINEYHESIYNLKVGPVDFGIVDMNTTTDFKPIDEGNYKLSGKTSGLIVEGDVSLTGSGTKEYTLRFLSNGKIELEK